uniref:CPBP family intramembrane glutamic endopeptidase n=1 Tax=Candidatus Enterococcus willemsii TaxID=1857215 RepID=UPI00403FB22F
MYDSELKDRLMWFTHSSKIKAIFVGLFMPIIVILPFVVFYFSTPIAQRGGEVPLSIIPSLLIFSLLGNFLEELLFRGYVQSYLREQMIGRWRRILLSGLFFSAGHIFLASTVTDLGLIILLFTFWEGFICALVYEKYGIISATLTHGLSIFLLSSGFL